MIRNDITTVLTNSTTPQTPHAIFLRMAKWQFPAVQRELGQMLDDGLVKYQGDKLKLTKKAYEQIREAAA